MSSVAEKGLEVVSVFTQLNNHQKRRLPIGNHSNGVAMKMHWKQVLSLVAEKNIR